MSEAMDCCVAPLNGECRCFQQRGAAFWEMPSQQCAYLVEPNPVEDTEVEIDGKEVTLPVKDKGCEHQHEHYTRCQPALLVSYHHEECGASWTQFWSAACDDECPTCGVDIEASDWEVVAPCACKASLD